jgi:hypothetical protein
MTVVGRRRRRRRRRSARINPSVVKFLMNLLYQPIYGDDTNIESGGMMNGSGKLKQD